MNRRIYDRDVFELSRKGLNNLVPYYHVKMDLSEFSGEYIDEPALILTYKVRLNADTPGYDLFQEGEIEFRSVSEGLDYYEALKKFYIDDIKAIVEEYGLTKESGYEEAMPDIYSLLIMRKI